MDWETFSSAHSEFVDPQINAQLEGTTLCSDPPEHTMLRTRRSPAMGTRVALYGVANRDGRKYPGPDKFDITRRPSDQLAFGHGEHAYIGMALARMEMSALLDHLADQISRLEVLASRPRLTTTSCSRFSPLSPRVPWAPASWRRM